MFINTFFKDEIVVKQENGENKVEVTGQSVWGTLKGLESFSQLIYSNKENGYAVSGLFYLERNFALSVVN